MDSPIAPFIFEALLRDEDVDDRLLKPLLENHILSTDDCFSRILHLQQIRSQISRDLVCESILDLLEILRKMDLKDGAFKAPDSMKDAYTAVAVECTLRWLRENHESEFSRTQQRIWRDRIPKLDSQFQADKMVTWFNEIETSIRSVEAREEMLKKDTRRTAVEAVEIYLSEAWEKLGLPSLERAAAFVLKNTLPATTDHAAAAPGVAEASGVAVSAAPGVAVSAAPGVAVSAAPGVAISAAPGVAISAAPGVAVSAAPGIAAAAAPGVAAAAAPGVAAAAAPGVAAPGVAAPGVAAPGVAAPKAICF